MHGRTRFQLEPDCFVCVAGDDLIQFNQTHQEKMVYSIVI
jgi:hypothetical protein